MKIKKYQFWFCTGSQDLYGDECLRHVAEHSKIMVERLNAPTIFRMNWSGNQHFLQMK